MDVTFWSTKTCISVDNPRLVYIGWFRLHCRNGVGWIRSFPFHFQFHAHLEPFPVRLMAQVLFVVTMTPPGLLAFCKVCRHYLAYIGQSTIFTRSILLWRQTFAVFISWIIHHVIIDTSIEFHSRPGIKMSIIVCN